MKFQRVNRSDAEKVFINVRNVSGATVSAGVGFEWDVAVATDGNAVTAIKSGSLAGLFVGINDASLADSSYGLCQVYGYRSDCYMSRACAGDTPGAFLKPVAGYFDTGQTLSAATTSGHIFVSLLETIAASAAYSSAAQVYSTGAAVFIRAM